MDDEHAAQLGDKFFRKQFAIFINRLKMFASLDPIVPLLDSIPKTVINLDNTHPGTNKITQKKLEIA